MVEVAESVRLNEPYDAVALAAVDAVLEMEAAGSDVEVEVVFVVILTSSTSACLGSDLHDHAKLPGATWSKANAVAVKFMLPDLLCETSSGMKSNQRGRRWSKNIP